MTQIPPNGAAPNEPISLNQQVVNSATGQTCSVEYFCEYCEFYPILPVHGHYECPQCGYKTKCCEGAPLD